MTETPEAEEELAQPGPAPEFDWLLESHVAVANMGSEPGLGVTLIVSGVVVTGRLASAEAWGHAQDAALGIEADGEGTMAGMMKDVGARAEQDEAGHRKEPYRYIHLLDAHVYAGSQAIPTHPHPGVPWRGRISSVDGWILGTAAPSD